MKREIIRIDEDKCTGCGLCVPNCAEGSLVIIDGKAKMVADKYCDGLGACIGHCPEGALTIEVREADEYDHAAVEDLLERPMEEREAMAKGDAGAPSSRPLQPLGGASLGAPQGGGCPGSAMRSLTPTAPAGAAPKAGLGSSLSHWPIQLRLVPADAPYLKNADLLLVADCTAVSMPDFHQRYVPGKVVLMGCPKFDDQDMYVDKLAQILKTNDIASITMLQMEVPCCASLGAILASAFERTGASVPTELVVSTLDGQIKEQRKFA